MSSAATLGVFAIFGLMLIALPVVAIAGAVISARRREWRFEFSRVISNMSGAIGRAPLLFFGVAVLVTGLPYFLIYASMGVLPGYDAEPILPQNYLLIWGATMLVGATIGTFAQLVMIRAALDAVEHGEVDVGAALRGSLRLLVPAIVLGIMQTLAIALGFMMLVVPALILMTMWIVALPAMVREGTGIFESFGRSRELTRGARWSIFLLLIIFMVFWSIVSGLFEFFGVALGGYWGLAVSALGAGLVAAIAPAGAAAIYHELRTEKEGGVADDLQAVFA